ncbi:hypothetical protein [Candidatus Vidania fulgoroideorum]
MRIIKIRSIVTDYNSSKVSLRNFQMPIFFIKTTEFLRYGYKLSIGSYYYVFFDAFGKVKLCNNEHLVRLKLKRIFKKKGIVHGYINRKVKGGYEVKVGSSLCFLPSSLSSNECCVNVFRSFKIVRFSNRDNNIILSRKDYIIEKRTVMIERLLENRSKIITVVIKSISKFGIFATYKNIDGLLKIKRSVLRLGFIKEGVKVRASVYNWNSSNGRVTYKFNCNIPCISSPTLNGISYYREVYRGRRFSKLSLNKKEYIVSRYNMNWVVNKLSSKTYIDFLYRIPSHNIYIYNPWVEFNIYVGSSVIGFYYKCCYGIYIYKLPFNIYGFCNFKVRYSIFNIKYVDIYRRFVILA